MKQHELDDPRLQFISAKQDVEAIQDRYLDFFSYDSFFVVVENGQVAAMWGVYGTEPTADTDVHMLVP